MPTLTEQSTQDQGMDNSKNSSLIGYLDRLKDNLQKRKSII
jgi:hypothetical protein